MRMPHDDYESAESHPFHAHRRRWEHLTNPKVLPVPTREGGDASDNVCHLADRLLRRGFPLHLEARGLVLSPGNWERDLAYFAELIAPLQSESPGEPLDIWKGSKRIARIDVSRIQERNHWQNSVLDYMQRGCETQYGHPHINKDPWRSFQVMKYGAKTEVKSLETGVALLVKVLPWVSVRTIMSCHGHRDPAKIWFSSFYHSQWCEMIFRELFRDLPIRKFFRFEHGELPESTVEHGELRESKGDSHLIFASRLRSRNLETECDLFDQIQIMARRLFDPELCQAIREAKKGSHDLEDMKHRLHQAIRKHRRSRPTPADRAAAFDRIRCLPQLPEIGMREKSPGEKVLADTLLRRGFPVRLEDRGLVLCPGAMPEDVEFLGRLLRRLEPVAEPTLTCDVWSGHRLVTTVAVDDPWQLDMFRRRVLFGRSTRSSGMIGPPVRETELMNSFDGFLRCRFGARFPLVYFEEGVALLVKVLPWVGVLTSMSCQGHLDRVDRLGEAAATPCIWFYNHFHSEWCRLIFERLCGDLEIARLWEFDSSGRNHWLGCTWHASKTPPKSAGDQKVLFEQIQEIARRFFDPELCRVIREAKARATSLDDLAMCLDQGLADFQMNGGRLPFQADRARR